MLNVQHSDLLTPCSGPLKVPFTAIPSLMQYEDAPPPSAGAHPPVSHLLKKRDISDINQANTTFKLIHFSLIIPTYNERENIQSLIHSLTNLLDSLIPQKYEIILVDDDSPDRSWEVAHSLTSIYAQLKVMRRQHERGLASAVIRGWQVSSGQVLGVMDADLQHPPEVLLKLLDRVNNGADLAIASRHIPGGGVSEWSFKRRFLSRGAQILGLILLPNILGRVSDPMSGYFVLRREVIAEKVLHPTGYKILLEVLGRGTVKTIAEVEYIFQERSEGVSKVTWRQYLDYMIHLLRLLKNNRWTWQWYTQFPLTRFIRYTIVGLSGLFIDMTIFYLLSDPTSLAWGLTYSKIIAAEIAIINNFLWHDRWTFADLIYQQERGKSLLKRLIKFNLISLAGLCLNILVLNSLFNGIEINRYLANLIAIGAVTVWNFWINFKLNWRVTEVT